MQIQEKKNTIKGIIILLLVAQLVSLYLSYMFIQEERFYKGFYDLDLHEYFDLIFGLFLMTIYILLLLIFKKYVKLCFFLILSIMTMKIIFATIGGILYREGIEIPLGYGISFAFNILLLFFLLRKLKGTGPNSREKGTGSYNSAL